MAKMYPNSIAEYMPTDSEKIVYTELKNQLPDSFSVFYSVNWTSFEAGKLVKSEADFVVVSPDYGFLCLEVKGGSKIRVDENNKWYISDNLHGERKLTLTPFDQAEKSMYYFFNMFSNKYNVKYSGIFGAGVMFPFYPVDESLNLDNRHRACTIDSNDLNNIYDKIKKMYRLWGGCSYGRNYYSLSQHNAFMELIRERLAISAAAGALIKYKEHQLDIINRVQDNYIYFIQNVKQFFIRGGAGTGKTWIAKKMAEQEASKGNKVLFVCASKTLASEIRLQINSDVDVYDIRSLFEEMIEDISFYTEPIYKGIATAPIKTKKRYEAIFVDEAQDFTVEWAKVLRALLADTNEARMGVFYDDVQIVREHSFGDGFEIEVLPFLLHENIRNTANIYKWTAEKTNLGRDVIANPVEGPSPTSEILYEKGQLTLRLESMFKQYFDREYLANDSLVIITDEKEELLFTYRDGIAKWNLVAGKVRNENDVSVYSIDEFKGLEANMVIYIHDKNTNDNLNYIAYTRAKYYLIELVRNY